MSKLHQIIFNMFVDRGLYARSTHASSSSHVGFANDITLTFDRVGLNDELKKVVMVEATYFKNIAIFHIGALNTLAVDIIKKIAMCHTFDKMEFIDVAS